MPLNPHIEEEVGLTRSQRLFPQANIKNIRLYYLFVALNNCWFIAANWIFYWTRFMTYGQLGIMDATAFAFGLLLEVPSGAVADLFGKKKTLVFAMFALAVSTFWMSIANDYPSLWIAFMIAQIGFAFYSGAAEALAYDTLVEEGKGDKYAQVAATVGQIASVTSVVATLLGGLLYVLHFRLSHVAWSVAYTLALVTSLGFSEPKIDTEKFTWGNYARQLKEGVSQLLLPRVRPFLIVILALLGADYLFGWGLVKPTMAKEFGFLDREQALLFALLSILGALAVRQIPRIREVISDRRGLYLLTIVMGAGFMLAYFKLGFWGLVPLLLIHMAGHLAHPWVSIVVNDEIASQFRATALSAVALITRIPYVLLAVLAGNMAQNGTFGWFNLFVGMGLVISIYISSIAFLGRKKAAILRMLKYKKEWI